MNGVVTFAPARRSYNHRRHIPRQMPGWLQFIAVLICVLQVVPGNRLSTLTEQTPAEIAASASGRTTTYGYDLNGNIAQKTLPNGDVESVAFDALNRDVAQAAANQSGASLYSFAYAYDLGGNLLQDTETYPSGLNNRTVTNTYDAINRLSQEAVTGAAPNLTTAYTYDSAN